MSVPAADSLGRSQALIEQEISQNKARGLLKSIIAIASLAFGILASVYLSPYYLCLALPIFLLAACSASANFRQARNLSDVAQARFGSGGS